MLPTLVALELALEGVASILVGPVFLDGADESVSHVIAHGGMLRLLEAALSRR